MFATLLGRLPWPDGVPAGRFEAAVEAAIEAQVAAGLEPLTDGGFAAPGASGVSRVAAWRAAAGRTDRAMKAVIEGPYTAAAADPAAALSLARAMRDEIAELAMAGCALIEIHEPAATGIGTDAAARAAFLAAEQALLADLDGIHVSLAIVGGNADTAGIETILGAPFASLALDLIAGPDNWRLAAAAPADRGIVCGALSTAIGGDDGPELLLFAARYAASLGGRGPDRVGLATAGGLDHLSWADAVRRLRRLGDGARIAGLPRGPKLAAALDPKAIDIRSAAAGRHVRRPPRRGGGDAPAR